MTGPEVSHLVDAVTAYGLVLAGLLTVALGLLMTRQPWRWLLVYICVVLTGVAAVWYYGFGQPFPARVADIGTSLALVWAIQLAFVGDFYTGRGGRLLNLVFFLANLEYIITFAIGAQSQAPLVLASNQFGGLNFGELLLILNCAVAVTLVYGRRRDVQPEARPLLNVVTLLFFVGLLLSIASNAWTDVGILAFHATTQILAAFGFVALWAFNEMRFGLASYAEEETEVPVPAPAEEEFEVIFSPDGEILVPAGHTGGLARLSQG